VQQELHRGGRVVAADQDRRVIRVEGEGQGAAGVLLACTIEALNRAAIMGAADPLVAGAELELRDFWLRLDRG
jgi:hypothetical protein